jgi:trehalose 6-phosphate synthase/phosphatase
MADRPPNPRLGSINPVFDPKNTDIPVTPGFDGTGRTSFFQNKLIPTPASLEGTTN